MVFELWISRLSICFSPNGGMPFRLLPHAVAVLQSGLVLLSFISRSGSLVNYSHRFGCLNQHDINSLSAQSALSEPF